eukprot:CAMPEP_0178445304 /NCGR_PEP_ID=MMETSP0689_2-20121128/40069_1 /TAXON_ID=160604 /ORGANISM="Amphidinium massartii, Strain CS-259" /LENGTH=207 /DNA_ID=CAMNT_0020069793 /DNA_START=1 /DNA_END=624 /DNA_ORIENTATION=-
MFCMCCDASHETMQESTLTAVTTVSAMADPAQTSESSPSKVATATEGERRVDASDSTIAPMPQPEQEEPPKLAPEPEADVQPQQQEDGAAGEKKAKKKRSKINEEVDYDSTLVVPLSRDNGQAKLGMVAYNNEGEDFMRIRSIAEKGLIATWNAEKQGSEDQLVKVGYHIVAVNEVQVPSKMKSVIVDTNIRDIKLTLRRAVPKPAQ